MADYSIKFPEHYDLYYYGDPDEGRIGPYIDMTELRVDHMIGPGSTIIGSRFEWEFDKEELRRMCTEHLYMLDFDFQPMLLSTGVSYFNGSRFVGDYERISSELSWYSHPCAENDGGERFLACLLFEMLFEQDGLSDSEWYRYYEQLRRHMFDQVLNYDLTVYDVPEDNKYFKGIPAWMEPKSREERREINKPLVISPWKGYRDRSSVEPDE